MTAVCPNNPDHREFATVATVMEEWKVDRQGNRIDTIRSIETTHPPDPENTWNCVLCGAEAKVTRG